MEIDVSRLFENIYILHEANSDSPVDAYLLVGNHRAALIDTLQNATGLYGKIRELTTLPVDVLITHGHWDHVGKSILEFADAGCNIYMNLQDIAQIQFFDSHARIDFYKDLKDGALFDLGGFQLETIFCGGHTQGSVVFLDREHQLLFSGDSIGSGNFWMQLPGSTSMKIFLHNLETLRKKLQGMEQLTIHPGHRWQMPQILTNQYIEDIRSIAEGIMNGSFIGTEEVLLVNDISISYRTVSFGMVSSFCYDPTKMI